MHKLPLTVLLLALIAPSAVRSQAPRTPVLVELFTSEGCSSCPPADAVLARLLTAQPVAEAEIIPLAFHVDYWDRLGWKDPYASASATRRQHQYASAHFGDDRVYTPQMIVDGTAEFTGGDEARAIAEIRKAAAQPHLPMRITAQLRGTDLRLSVDAPAAKPDQERIDIIVAVIEDALTSTVRRGENSGRTLPHTAVVRRFDTIGALEREAFVTDGAWKINPAWQRAQLRVVAFLQGQKSGRIYGAASGNVE
jgi:hypothetical protein